MDSIIFNTANISDAIGGIGAVMVVVTYFLLQTKTLSSHDLLFSVLNTFSSLMIVYSLIYHWNMASFIIEVFWVLISLYGIYNYYIGKKNSKKKIEL